jgi:hypothetical protein
MGTFDNSDLMLLDDDSAINTSNAIIQDAKNINTSVGDINLMDVIKDAVADKEMLGETISIEAYQLIRIITDRIKEDHNLSSNVRVISTEAFLSKFSAKSINRLALEDAAGIIIEIWNKIKATIASVWNAIKDFFVKIFDSNERLLKSAESLKQRVNNSDVEEPDEASFENKGVAKYFPYPKVNMALVDEVLKTHAASVDTFNKSVDAFDHLTSELERYAGDESGSATLNEEVFDKFAQVANTILKLNDKTVFNTTIEVKIKTEDDKKSLAGKKVKKVEVKFETGKADSNITCDTLSKDDMDSVCDAVIELCKDNQGMKKAVAKTDTSGKRLTKLMDKAIDLAKKEQAEASRVTSEKQAAAKKAQQEREAGRQEKSLGTKLLGKVGVNTKASKEVDKVNRDLDNNVGKADDSHKFASAVEKEKTLTADKLNAFKGCVSPLITAINKIVSGYPTLNLEAGKGALVYVSASLGQYKNRFGGKTKEEARSSEEE